MKCRRWIARGLVGCALLAPLGGRAAGTLDAVEEKLDETPASSQDQDRHAEDDDGHRRRRHHYHGGYYSNNAYADGFGLILGMMLGGLFSSLGGSGNWAENYRTLKQEWHPALPTIRVEGAYQSLGSDTNAYNLNLTAGYMGLGVDCDFLHAFEKTPGTQMKFISPHALLRAAPTKWWQIDLALGAKVIRGSRTHSGFEAGLPMYFYIGKHAIIDVKPYYARVGAGDIVDLALGVSGKWKMLGARAGYRWIDVSGTAMHGPMGGVFAQW